MIFQNLSDTGARRIGIGLAAGRVRRRVGLGLLLWAVLVHPVLALAMGRPWVQAEVFGLAPDPTAIAVLGVLLGLAVRRVEAKREPRAA